MVRLCEAFAAYGLYVTERSESDFAPELAQRHDAAMNSRSGRVGSGGASRPRTLAAAHQLLPRGVRVRRRACCSPASSRSCTHERLCAAARADPRPAGDRAGDRLRQPPGAGPGARGAHRRARVPRRQPQAVPQWLLVVMHHSGLFDEWRMPIATGIAWFARCRGRRARLLARRRRRPRRRPCRPRTTPRSCSTPTRVFHGVDRVAAPTREPFAARSGTALRAHDERRPLARPRAADDEVARYDWDELRFSVSWKAYCFADEAERDAWRTHADDLSARRDPRHPGRRPARPWGAARRRADRAGAGPVADRDLRALPGSRFVVGGGGHVDPGGLDAPGSQLGGAGRVGGVGRAHVQGLAVGTTQGAGVGGTAGGDPVDGTGALHHPHDAPVHGIGAPGCLRRRRRRCRRERWDAGRPTPGGWPASRRRSWRRPTAVARTSRRRSGCARPA